MEPVKYLSKNDDKSLISPKSIEEKIDEGLEDVDNGNITDASIVLEQLRGRKSQSIEEKLKEAEKDQEQGRVHSEEEVWSMFSEKYRIDL